MSKIPESWLTTLIGEVCNVASGGTPKASDENNFSKPGTGYAWVTPADLSGYKRKTISHGSRDLSLQGLSSSSATLLPRGTILFSSRAPIGYVAIAENEISTNQGFKNFVLPEELNSSYTYYYLKSIKRLAESMGTGTTFKELSGKVAKTLPFVLAPQNEQIRIANKLDSLLAKVQSAETQLKKIPTLLKRFRQSVLAAALSGKLGEGFDVNNWAKNTLGDLSSVGTGVTPLKSNKAFYEGGEIPWLTSSVTGQKVVTDSEHYVTDYALKNTGLKIYPKGTLLVAMYGEGKTRGQVTELGIDATINQACAAIKVDESLADRSFIKLSIKNNYEKTRLMAEGGAQPNLNLGKVRSIPVNLPPLVEQKEIVRRVEQLFTLADSVEEQFNNAKKQVEKLTQSILAKAFRGELVPQDPNDEPAEKLLERIKSEQAKLEKASKITKRKTKMSKKKDIAEISGYVPHRSNARETAPKKITTPRDITKVQDALIKNNVPLTGKELLLAAGYPEDADSEQIEDFYLDLREQINKGYIECERTKDNEDIIRLVVKKS